MTTLSQQAPDLAESRPARELLESLRVAIKTDISPEYSAAVDVDPRELEGAT